MCTAEMRYFEAARYLYSVYIMHSCMIDLAYRPIHVNTMQLIFDIALLTNMHAKLNSALSRLGGADAILL